MKPTKELLNKSILNCLKNNHLISSKEVHNALLEVASYATIKRALKQLFDEGMVSVEGIGKATKYKISEAFELIHPIDPVEYFMQEIDERKIKSSFNHSLIRGTLVDASIFNNQEIKFLTTLQDDYTNKITRLSENLYRKELERLSIDLSWKSSQIEGNTYSLLETEHLLKEKQTAAGKTKDEAVMLLNHKSAIDFIIENPDYVNPLRIGTIQDIHSMLIKELNVERNIRSGIVGISGTNYKPLDNQHQIRDALEEMIVTINEKQNIFEKALLALLLISYIQPFDDGNKRTARIISNGILINHNYCPLSFRTVDALDYKKAMLIFYEQNNLSVVKKIFIEQFEFAVKSYF